MTTLPEPAYGLYDSAFAVAPNSPGYGNNDILFFGSIILYRSADRAASGIPTLTPYGHVGMQTFMR